MQSDGAGERLRAEPRERTQPDKTAVAEPLPMGDVFHRIACVAAQRMGSPWAFLSAVLVILAWAVTGPMFHFGDTWQLVINTGTTIITFLMVFLIQSSQNRDARALHLKLDELIRTSQARNAFAGLQDATEKELDTFSAEFKELRAHGVEPEAAAVEARQRARITAAPEQS